MAHMPHESTKITHTYDLARKKKLGTNAQNLEKCISNKEQKKDENECTPITHKHTHTNTKEHTYI